MCINKIQHTEGQRPLKYGTMLLKVRQQDICTKFKALLRTSKKMGKYALGPIRNTLPVSVPHVQMDVRRTTQLGHSLPISSLLFHLLCWLSSVKFILITRSSCAFPTYILPFSLVHQNYPKPSRDVRI